MNPFLGAFTIVAVCYKVYAKHLSDEISKKYGSRAYISEYGTAPKTYVLRINFEENAEDSIEM